MITNAIARAAEYNIKNPSNFVKYTSAASNAFAFACQAAAFSVNKNIPDEQRKFVVAQEAAEGIISTSILLTLASGFKKIGEKLVEKAMIVPSTLPNELRNPKAIAKILAEKTEHAELINKYKSGMGLATSVLGVIAAFNIVTPIIRNKIASIIQKKQQKTKPEEENNTKQLDSSRGLPDSNKPTQPNQIDPNLFKDFLAKNNN